MIRRRQFLESAGAAAVATSLPLQTKAAGSRDFIVYGATIHTVDPRHAQAEAFVVRSSRFVYVGSLAGAKAAARPNAKMLNLHGSTVLPGLIDAHMHLQSVGLDLGEVPLHHVVSFEEVVARTVAFTKTSPDQWIMGTGWDQNLWQGKQFPTHDALSQAIADRPVVLERVDGHAILANAKAMELAGVTKGTQDPPGGLIVRDANGNPTGVFVDNAMALIYSAVPKPSIAQLERATVAAIKQCHSYGLTGGSDAGCGGGNFEAYQNAGRSGALNLRINAMIADNPQLIDIMTAHGPINGAFDGRLWIRSIKLFIDGALGSRGAALLQPYADDPANRGLMRTTQAHIEEVAAMALKRGFQMSTHAIGDRGNRTVLDAFENALRRHPKRDHRFRIEHAQILSLQDIPRFAQLGVIPSMQTTHQISDMSWAEARLGHDRILGGYAWRSLLQTGVIIANGTDAPVEEVSTLRTFHAAISRQNEQNQPPGGWYPQQRMTRDEAVKSMTVWAAQAAFQDDVMGSITPGKFADFVVMDRDWMSVPHESIMDTKVQATYFAGRPVYEAPIHHTAMASRRGLHSRLHRPCACG